MSDLSVFLAGVLLAYSAFLLSIMSPGPNVLAIMGTSMGVGRISGIALAMGVSTGTFIWGSLTVLGMSALLAKYAFALTLIKIVGGLYLLWLAYKAFKAASVRYDIHALKVDKPEFSPLGYYVRGLAV